MGAPFVVLEAVSFSTARVCATIGAKYPILGEFGHLAKGLADLIDSGLTLQFPNRGTVK
jgi:hypothetical protein